MWGDKSQLVQEMCSRDWSVSVEISMCSLIRISYEEYILDTVMFFKKNNKSFSIPTGKLLTRHFAIHCDQLALCNKPWKGGPFTLFS